MRINPTTSDPGVFTLKKKKNVGRILWYGWGFMKKPKAPYRIL
jgi:hypothetical protein